MALAARLDRLSQCDLGERAAVLDELIASLKKGEFGAAQFDEELYSKVFAVLIAASAWAGGGTAQSQADVHRAQQVFWAIVRIPTFEPAAAADQVTEELLWSVASRSGVQSALQEEWPYVRDIFLWFYQNYAARRATLRSLIGRILRTFVQVPHRGVPVPALLQALEPIIRGFEAPLMASHKNLLFELLLPLHKPHEWMSWDRQTPLISMYHKELLTCTKLFLDKQPSLATRCLETICTHFPPVQHANTPKEVLLVYELGSLMKYLSTAGFHQLLPTLLKHILRLLRSENAQPIQSVLQFWKNEHFVGMCAGESEQIIPVLVPALLRGGEVFWNPTVNRMTSVVLEKLEDSNPQLFEETVERLWGVDGAVPAFEEKEAAAAKALPSESAEKSAETIGSKKQPRQPDVSSMKFCMGGWKPPGGSSAGGTAAKPPLTATGVAPWAFKGGAAGGGKQPPLTTTGVAPWAFNGSRGSAGARPKPPSLGTFKEEDPQAAEAASASSAAAASSAGQKSGMERVQEFKKRLCPNVEDTGGAQSWEVALNAETPTLLPDLKFHQLVFGAEDLGVGAFSTVKYARAIQKEGARSRWPEYAVKVINTKTMEELGYEASVNREICVLRMLSHPGIARMVSSFKWRDGAYLVLEYAAKGDLHGLLVARGKFEEDVAQFFLGETIAALSAIHGIGFVYGDLKPENIVITATGHAKITDFGGCRPVTEEARNRTRQSLLRSLRDGDWRAQDGQQANPQPPEDVESALPDDSRVEGTTIYLPPEVIQGAAPSCLGDAWALGCLACQLLTGKPPLWAESDDPEEEDRLRARIVAFDFANATTLREQLPARAVPMISDLLQPVVAARISVTQAGAAEFFAGVDVFTLYTKPCGPDLPEVERQAPQEDVRWQKRQYSQIWTVMPTQRDYTLPAGGSGNQPFVELIAEGEERSSPFLDAAVQPVRASRIESL